MHAFVPVTLLNPKGWVNKSEPTCSSFVSRAFPKAHHGKRHAAFRGNISALNEGELSECISWLSASSGRVSNLLDFSCIDPRSKRGVKLTATKKVLERTELASFPEGTFIGVKAAKKLLDEAHPGFSSYGFVTNNDDYVALAVLLEFGKGSSSFFGPFLKTFPEQDNLDCIPLWTSEELEMLRGCVVRTDVINWLENTKEEWSVLDKEVFQKDRVVFSTEHFNLQKYRWALCATSSRGHYVSESEPTVLAPILSLLLPPKPKHTPSVRVELNGGMFFSKKKLILTARRDMNDGDSVSISYGKSMRNAELAFTKGLTVDDPRYDSVFLSFEISSLDRFYEDKQDILEKCDVEINPKFEIVAGEKRGEHEAPDDMDPFLRLLCLTGADSFLLEAVFRGEVWGFMELPVSADNEKAMCELVINACADSLDEYSDKLNHIDADLMSYRQRMAKRVIDGEKEILQDVQKAYQRRLDSLDGLEYYAERRLRILDLLRPIDESEIVDSESGGRVARAFDENY